jgi:hypothetical protein
MRQKRASGMKALGGLLLAALIGGVLALSAPPAQAQSPGSSVTYNTGWNLVAFPPSTDLSQVQASLYTMQAGDTDYETIDPSQGTQSGFGYWAYFYSPTTINLAAGSSDLYAVLPPPGQYIMVGDPSGSLPALISGADVVWTYDPVAGYANSALINPGQGAWVYSAAGNAITVTPTANATPPPPAGSRPPAGRFYGAVTVSGAAAASGTPITARSSSGATCGTSTVGAPPASGSTAYVLDLTGSDSGCTTPGSPLTFTVGGSNATASGSAAVPDASGAVHVDLSR